MSQSNSSAAIKKSRPGVQALSTAISTATGSLLTVLKVTARSPHHPSSGHQVPQDFAGICVAAFSDSACNARQLTQLKALGVRQVRVDYTYESPGSETDEFLQLLADNGFSICLHIVQPMLEARAMHTAGARRTWLRFVRRALLRWGGRIEAIEIGSTVNRRRWAGYNLPGFMAAWLLATREIRKWPVRFAGPNVTDFEPLYNAGLLRIFRRLGVQPDIHTNNLFVERIIEPEAYDTRVGGRLLTRLLNFNLVKKANLLQAIGASNGVPEMWCTHVSWTAPRIQRFIADTEQKQADYLSRYYVLAAASGAVARVYWGALVCQRAGLLNDCTDEYPDQERVTLYDRSYGAARTCRVAPAFDALKTINNLIAGTRYLGRRGTDEQLQIHVFGSQEHQLHVVWTTNGRAAVLRSIYSAADLEDVHVFGRGGKAEPCPDIAGEAPVFLQWPAEREVETRATSPMRALSIHRHAPEKRHFLWQDEQGRAIFLAGDEKEFDMLRSSLAPDRLVREDEVMLRDARNAIWLIDDPRQQGRQLVVKQPVRLRAYKKLYQRLRPSKARQSWNGASELLRRGIHTPHPVAFIECRGSDSITRNFYICELLEEAVPARRFLTAFAAGASIFEGVTPADLHRQLSQFVVTMHNRGVYFRDLSSGNILVRAGDTLEFSLVDTARARFFNRPATIVERLSDLKRLCFKMSWEHRQEFTRLYMEACGRRHMGWHRLPFMFYDFKINTKRFFLRKRRVVVNQVGS